MRKTTSQNPLQRRRTRTARWRLGIQILFFLCAPSAFASAFAGVKELFDKFSRGEMLEWTSFAAALLLLLVFTILFGRFFCGYACAFGALGDWIYALSAMIQRKTGQKIPKLPARAVKWLQAGKYLVLLAVLILCVAGELGTVNANSPWTVFSFLSSGHAVPGGMKLAVGLLLLIVCGMAVCERFFCQFLCPMGAVFSLLPVIGMGQLLRNRENCAPGCRACTAHCPVGLELQTDSLRSGECIRCGKCSAACPKQNITSGWTAIRGNEIWWVLLQTAALLIGLWAIT